MSSTDPPHPKTWWKSAVVYQIYPISFFDSNGDGFGDLNGIRAKLDYLKELGVDVLWLSPIYKSPLADMGYDISDYRDVDSRYGTLQDWDDLIRAVHDRGMKLMMDLVTNHTSDEHQWFVESRSSPTHTKRDWYFWRPPKIDKDGNKKPPNNWRSVFQGPAWTYDSVTDAYYLHLYLSKQPDLNWDNPEVRRAVFDLMEFWIQRGCDGFRMDVINLISKTPGLPDAPVVDPREEYQPASVYYANGPHVHEYLKEMNEKVLSRHDLITVGETPFTDDYSKLVPYVLPSSRELNTVFQFELQAVDSPEGGWDSADLFWKKWRLSELKKVVNRWQTFERENGFWNAVYIENHDQGRSVSRFGNDSPEWRSLSAKMLAIFQASQTGTLYVYQGEELGMKNTPKDWPLEEYKDVCTINFWDAVLEQRRKESGSKEVDMSDALEGIQRKARDHARTPVQWNSSAHGGFTTGTPWMRVNDDYGEWNAASQVGDPESVFSFWKKTLKVRKENDVLIYGEFRMLAPEDEQVFAFTRRLGSIFALMLLNFTENPASFVLDEEAYLPGAKLLLCNYPAQRPGDGAALKGREVDLRGYEGRVYLLSPSQ